jgi:predicted AlkP superfamily pyrophosphatase or phosphodiesterase
LGKRFRTRLTMLRANRLRPFTKRFTATPWANDYQLDLARVVIDNEQLGADNDTDVLGVSITATDIAGHAFGPDSLEVQDMIVRLDRQLADSSATSTAASSRAKFSSPSHPIMVPARFPSTWRHSMWKRRALRRSS